MRFQRTSECAPFTIEPCGSMPAGSDLQPRPRGRVTLHFIANATSSSASSICSHFRAIATRYDKLARNFFAGVTSVGGPFSQQRQTIRFCLSRIFAAAARHLVHRIFSHEEPRRTADNINAVAQETAATKHEPNIAEMLQCLIKSSSRTFIVVPALAKHRYPLVRPQWNAQVRATSLEPEARRTEPAVEFRHEVVATAL